MGCYPHLVAGINGSNSHGLGNGSVEGIQVSGLFGRNRKMKSVYTGKKLTDFVKIIG